MSLGVLPDFGALMPEINSALMYAGAGPGPMVTAAAAWDALATDLYGTAAAYGSAITGLSSAWRGPSAMSMVAAATPYVAWLHATAGQAEQAGAQAKAAVAAYEMAFAATVPPPVIAANRALLLMLVATNFFGQNAPAIAATEAHYAEMWAQDSAAMYGYAGACSVATATLPLFVGAPATANGAGLSAQLAQAVQTGGTAAGSTGQSMMATATAGSAQAASVPATTATTGATASSASSATPASSALTGLSSLSALAYPAMLLARLVLSPMNAVIGRMLSIGMAAPAAGQLGSTAHGPGGPGRGLRLVGLAYPTQPSPVGIARASLVGRLSVPPRWVAMTAPLSTPPATVLPEANPLAARKGSPGASFGIPVAHAGGRNTGSTPARYEMRPNVLPRWTIGG